MPAIWKSFPVVDRQSVVDRIDNYYAAALLNDTDPWCKMNVLDLMEIVPMAEVDRIRACYLVAKREPDVITRTESELDATVNTSLHSIFDHARLLPTELMKSYLLGKSEFIPSCVVTPGCPDVWTKWRPEEENWKPLLHHVHYRAGRKR
jgi:hypothetical protein